MGGSDLRATGARLVEQAKVLRDGTSVLHESVVPLPPEPPAGDGAHALWAALVCLREEMILVHTGSAEGLTVLGDEIACAERLLNPR